MTMPRALHIVLGAAMLGACSLPADELCPCQTASCQIESHRCIALEGRPTATNGSVIYDMDGRLYCSNQPNQPVYREPRLSSDVVDTMTSPYSWFKCWQLGATPGDMTRWYFTRGDENDNDGWMPEDKLDAPMEFKADPALFGFLPCASQ